MILKILEDTTYDKDYMNEEYNVFDDEIDEFAEPGYNEDTAISFEKDFKDFLNYYINLSNIFNEDFTSYQNLRLHFNKHCLGHSEHKRSTRNRIYYDFNDNSKYSQYEKMLSQQIESTKYKISSLYDYNSVLKYMRKLFEGNIVVRFTNGCDINNNGIINISFHSFASDVTKNYTNGNTIDLCIKNAADKTISLFAIDAHDVERRLNNVLSNYSDYNGIFHFNND